MLAAMQRAMAEMQAGGPSDEEFQRRFERLHHLFSTHPELRDLRPDSLKIDAAISEFHKANPDLWEGADDSDEARQRALAHVISNAFDEHLTDRLEKALTDALIQAKSPADADALVTGLMCVHLAKAGAPPGENPLLQMLLRMTAAEAVHTENVLQSLGVPTDPARVQELLAVPGEMEKLASDPDVLKKAAEIMDNDPAAREQAMRLARQAEEDLYQKIAKGEIQAHLTIEELAPVVTGLNELVARFDPGMARRSASEPFRKELVELLRRFADDPANRPAFERFAKEFREEGERAATAPGRDALKLRMLASIWADAWERDSYFRIRVAHASINRAAHQLRSDDDDAEEQEEESPPSGEPNEAEG